MSINLPVNVTHATLPAVYEAAKQSLAKCERVDECKSWADKAAALASYAKQAKDETLVNHARRIQARAINRAGELLKLIEPGKKGGDRHSKNVKLHGVEKVEGRMKTAADVGLSRRQYSTAIEVNNVPREDFERQVESDKPPTVTKLAEQGRKKRKVSRVTVKNSVDPLFLKLSEVAALMDKKSAESVVAANQAQFDKGMGLDREAIERLEFVRDWLDEVIRGSEKFVVTCSI